MSYNYSSHPSPSVVCAVTRSSSVAFSNPLHDPPGNARPHLPVGPFVSNEVVSSPTVQPSASSPSVVAGRKRSLESVRSADDHLNMFTSIQNLPTSPTDFPSAQSHQNSMSSDQTDVVNHYHPFTSLQTIISSSPSPDYARKSQCVRAHTPLFTNSNSDALANSTANSKAEPLLMSTTTFSPFKLDYSDCVLDKIRIVLGNGWKSFPLSQIAAVKGWERFILNHYPFSSFKILLYNEGLQAYLVETCSSTGLPVKIGQSSPCCYHLFRDDLSCARYIGPTIEHVVENLAAYRASSNRLLFDHSASPELFLYAQFHLRAEPSPPASSIDVEMQRD